ncbi:uncharacterized protein LOC129888300 [Solanum dulcamara]|uniref:uncharacterized protein LOC129888300 n=1 Tax=Solanum dulcamara TaxID=45834 RepID=UPI0024853120|nr:uncharacterized protein LOC129888300 [Solanum dulcamara]
MDNHNTSIVPYHDPFDDDDDDDDDSFVNISLFDENPTIDGGDHPPPLDENPTNLNSDFGVSDYDPILLDISYECSNHLVGNSTNAEGDVLGNNNNNNLHNCQILREITHADGLLISKLGIFGTIGRISHASLEKYTMDFSDQSHVSSQTYDFSNDSISSVKQFLVQYFEACKGDGYMVLEDPLCEFYQALGVGFDGSDCIDIDGLLQLSPTTSHDIQMEQQEMANEKNEGTSSDMRHEKIPLSAQRERTAKLKLKDFAGYLHLPIETAAKKLKICPTVMKKICRRDGLPRWPYRKIKSIKRKISERGKSLSSTDVKERESAKIDIRKLEKELANILKRIQ